MSAPTPASVAAGFSHPEQIIAHVSAAPFVCGTSSLGNLYRAIDAQGKLDICAAWFEHLPKPVVIDTAGRYGAGMALSEIGRCLRELKIPPQDVLISNKLGWRQTPLVGAEPTFEPGIWKEMTHDAEQAVSYKGILDCWNEGCDALGEDYRPTLASVHDPDEFLAAASSADERRRRMDAILDAYRALNELKRRGDVAMIGVGAKDWNVIREIHDAVSLDWIMFATLLTIYRHPPELVADIERLSKRGVMFINAGVFHSGFLVGGPYFNYRQLDPSHPDTKRLAAWRDKLYSICQTHGVTPAAASVQFSVSHPGINSVALNCDHARRVAENLEAARAPIADEFWEELKSEGVISPAYPYVG